MPSLKRWQEWAVPVAVLAGLFVILTPLPTGVIDLLIGANIILSIIILASALLAKSATDLTVFPAILLVSTLGRLVLNISTTRLILSNATTSQELAAGGIIRSFGDYVIGSDVFVGLVIFSIVFIVQFVVVTKGSSRISEVAARFALDGLPGKQMAIDADLKSGLISAEDARFERQEIQEKADFLGAMDGAGRFVRGDAVAGLVITLVNIIGGLGVGLLNGMEFQSAVEVYTLLTVGDGLVSQLPAFLVAIAAGILMARGSRESSVSEDMVSQLGADYRVMYIAGAGAVAMVFAGLPPVPLFLVGGVCFVVGMQGQSKLQGQLEQEAAEEAYRLEQEVKAKKKGAEFDHLLQLDPIEIKLGADVVPYADPAQGGALFSRVSDLRAKVLRSFGFVVPKVRISDSKRLGRNCFQILFYGDVVCEAALLPGGVLALDTGRTKAPLQGQEYSSEIGNGWWIGHDEEHRAEFFRYKVLTPEQLIVEFLENRVLRFSSELLTRDCAGQLIDEVKKIAPLVVQDLLPAKMSLSAVQQVLKNLLAEKVSIRQLALILEALGDYSPQTNQVEELVELVRCKLSRGICSRLAVQRTIGFVEFEESIEQRLIEQFKSVSQYQVEPEFGEDEFSWFVREIGGYQQPGRESVLVVDQRIRQWVRREMSVWSPELNVLGRDEVCGEFEWQKLGEVSLQLKLSRDVA